jgi:hypothetical protein
MRFVTSMHLQRVFGLPRALVAEIVAGVEMGTLP